MRISVQFRPDEGLALQAGLLEGLALKETLEVISELGGSLRPVHPGAEHSLLAPFFIIDVPSEDAGDSLLARLLEMDAVLAAYREPSVQPFLRPSQ